MTPKTTPFDFDVEKLTVVKNGIDPKLVHLLLEDGREEWRKMESKLEENAEKIARYEDERGAINSALLVAQKSGEDIIRQAQYKADQMLEEAKFKSTVLIDENKAAIKEIEQDLERMTLMKQKFADDFRALLRGYLAELDARFPASSTTRMSDPLPEPSTFVSEAQAD